MLLDVNVLLYADDEGSPHHEVALRWAEQHLNGPTRIGLPWPTAVAYLRLRTNPRVFRAPLTSAEATHRLRQWLGAPAVWVPVPTDRHSDVLMGLVERYHLTANAVPDAHLVALAIEHGVPIASADTDFALFTEIHWINPLAG